MGAKENPGDLSVSGVRSQSAILSGLVPVVFRFVGAAYWDSDVVSLFL